MVNAGYRKFSGRILLAVSLAAMCVFVWLFASVTAQFFAKQDAFAASQIVSRYFKMDAREIEAIANGAAPSDAFTATVERGLNANVFMAYRIFDPQGVLRYDSGSSAAAGRGGVRLPGMNIETARAAAATGHPITAKGEVETPAGLLYLGASMAPVVRDGKSVAVQEILIEQTERQNQLRSRITTLTMMAALLAAIAFGIPAMAWRRKSAALATREQEIEVQARRFKIALDNLPQGIILFDANGRLAVSNRSAADVLGIQMPALRIEVDAKEIEALRASAGVKTAQQPSHSDAHAHAPAGDVWEMHDGRTVKTLHYEVPGGGWVSLHEDITEELRAEEELQQAKQFLNTVIDNVPVAIVVKDAKTLRYELANRAVASVHGKQREEILGKFATDFFAREQAEKIDEADRKVIASAGTNAVVSEGIIKTPGNGDRIIATRRIAVRNAAGEAAWLISLLEDVTDLRNANDRITFLAHHDPLTGLSNRAHFQTMLNSIAASSRTGELTLALFDLDGFKEINDAFGHAAGDEVLRWTADCLRKHARAGDLVARLGGDEFALLFGDSLDEEQAEAMMARIFDDIRTPFEYETSKLSVEASAGIAVSADGKCDPDLLMRQADLALYEAKSQGKGVYCTYIPEIMERRLSRKALERDMHAAIAGDEFEVHYQPIVDLKAGAIVSMEALVRWRHPERGMISPMDFIPIAEESGLIIQIGEIVLRKACAAASNWADNIRVSVNFSPVQFRDQNLALKIANVLMQTGLKPSRLELEITEAALLDDSFDNIQMLTELRSTGIRIVMDDFGTGYSSLNYLRNFPFDKIKIDRSYVRDLEEGANHSRTILNAVLAMAQGLDLQTTAEGVETQGQMDILRNAGCKEMQGYFFSRPVPLADLEALFNRHTKKQKAA